MRTDVAYLHRELHFRSSTAPACGIPLGVRSVGYYHITSAWGEGRPRKPFVQIFWGEQGTGTLHHPGHRVRLGPGMVGVYHRDARHHVQGPSGQDTWAYRFVTLDGEWAPQALAAFGIGAGPITAGPPPVDLFERLRAALQQPGTPAEASADAIAYQLLARIAHHRPASDDPLVDRALIWLEDRWQDPHCSIARLAAACGVHRASLHRRFRAAQGISPSAWLTDRRLRHAMTLLSTSSDRIAAIAEESGYADPAYFARLFRQRTGLAPEAFRRQQ